MKRENYDPGIDNHSSWTSPAKKIEIADAVMLTAMTMFIAFALSVSFHPAEKSTSRITATPTPTPTELATPTRLK